MTAGTGSLELRQAAAESLARLGDLSALELLLDCLTDPLAEAATTERALRAWLEELATGVDTRAELALEVLAGWDELAFPSGAIVTGEERRTARAEKRRLLEAVLAELR